MKLLSFKEAIKESEGYNKRHLLLGNGFSIACVPSIFTYSSLYSRADFNDVPEVQTAFSLLDTTDFELVIHALENGSHILPAYLPMENATASKMFEHAQKVKERLIETIAKNHPAAPSDIENSKYKACATFLSIFLNRGCTIYSFNYDLLLYWVLMYAKEQNLLVVEPLDGFGRDADFNGGKVDVSEYVTWQGESRAHSQNIHYLHGALHIYDKGSKVEKFTWNDKKIRLVDQARKALSEGRFPVFVAEGESEKKMDRISHSGYLYHSFKSFSGAMAYRGKRNEQSCLFTFGVSFSENDQHILAKIAKGKVAHLFVSIYGDPSSGSNKQIIQSAEALKYKRANGDLLISYYDAQSANVWG